VALASLLLPGAAARAARRPQAGAGVRAARGS